jgi:hypothetical protein
MKSAKDIYILAVIVIPMAIEGCKQAYLPPATSTSASYLVVEGVINSGQDSTIIKISRTVNLSGNTSSNPELNAQVTVESDQNVVYALQDYRTGTYAAPTLNLDNTRKYHLRIKTADGKEYLSDFEAPKITPPIDSISFAVQSNGINVYANTHDPNNNTHYYRWDYQETWQFHAKYQSGFITNGTEIVLRPPDQSIFSCFGNNRSTSIVLGSSAQLARDVIYQTPVTQVTATSEKLETKYSILVRQYALTKDAFGFWQNLKKNTEQLGSIFDAQPSNINGNIHCTTNPAEPVIGYISVSTMQQKRLFIANAQLPSQWQATYPYECELDSALFSRAGQNDVLLFLIPLGSSEIPIAQIPGTGTGILGYFGAYKECADCTIRGVKQQPDFWR